MEYPELLNEIKNQFPDKAMDIIVGLDLLKMVINDTLKAVGNKINDLVGDKQFNKISQYSNMADCIGKYEKRIDDLISILDVDDIEEAEKIIEEADERKIPNYLDYIVDHKVEHSLYEDYTHKRPYGFKLGNYNIVEAGTWQEMLLKTSERLIAFNEEKFMSFEHNKSMNGKKKKYFSKSPENMRSPKKIANKIYIETNQSSNSIRNLIIKLLKEYGFGIKDYKLYLRADYTSLNE